MTIRRFFRMQSDAKLAQYVHGVKIGVTVEFEGEDQVGRLPDQAGQIAGPPGVAEIFQPKIPARGHRLHRSPDPDTPESEKTKALSEAGIEYVCQWVVDDLPAWLETTHGRLVSLPYGLDINDSVIYAIEKHSSPEMKLRIEQAIRTFERGIREQGRPRILTIPLHPHLQPLG